MAWHLATLNWLTHAALGGTLFLAAACLAVRACRQPVRRVRLAELALLGALAVPWAGRLPWLPHWSAGWLPPPQAAETAPAPEPAPEPAASPVVARPTPVVLSASFAAPQAPAPAPTATTAPTPAPTVSP